MVKGQATDLYGENHELSYEELIELHSGKTGALICAAVQLGCLAAGITPNDKLTEKLTKFAQKIGLAFQIIDDILDVTSSDEELGKNVGSDKENNKTTFMSFFTPDQAKGFAEELTEEAISEIKEIERSEVLIALALYLCDRKK